MFWEGPAVLSSLTDQRPVQRLLSAGAGRSLGETRLPLYPCSPAPAGQSSDAPRAVD